MVKCVQVSMLGGLRVEADGEVLLESAAKINKPWQVFCFLTLNRSAPASQARLLSAIWPGEELSDPANVLKNTVYALRKEFSALGGEGNLILFENGGYLCNPEVEFRVDAERFEAACEAAKTASGEEKVELLTQCAEMYRGELLPELENASWVMPLSLYYKKLYTECVGALCDILYERGEYGALLEAATGATQIDPLEEAYYTYTFRALFALGMHRVIIPTYHKTVRIFAEELCVDLSPEIQDIYRAASEQVDTIEQDIMILKDDLRQAQDTKLNNGPMYCTYDVFKYLCQMLARASERTGNRIIIQLLTLQNPDGGQIPAKTLSTAMNQIKGVLLGGLLRRSDTVARYSKTQYIIMLSVERWAGVEAVEQRLKKRLDPLLEACGVKMVLSSTEMEYI